MSLHGVCNNLQLITNLTLSYKHSLKDFTYCNASLSTPAGLMATVTSYLMSQLILMVRSSPNLLPSDLK